MSKKGTAEFRANCSAAFKLAWADPEKKAARMKKRLATLAEHKRIVQEFYAAHPQSKKGEKP